MKKKLLLFSLVLSGFVGTISSQKAFALVEGKFTVNGCSTKDGTGTIVSLGNTCGSGGSNCTANPCN